MTKGVLFDLYGVIMKIQTPDDIAAIERAAGFGGDELWQPYWANRPDYDAGLQSARDYWQQVAAASGHRIDDPDAVAAADVAGWSTVDAEMADYVRGLAERCPVGVLSDVPVEVIEMLQATQPWIWSLASVTLSAEVHGSKPDPVVYRQAMAGLGLDPNDIFYTDDRPGNVAAAQQQGMRAVVFPGLDELRPIIEAHLSQ